MLLIVFIASIIVSSFILHSYIAPKIEYIQNARRTVLLAVTPLVANGKRYEAEPGSSMMLVFLILHYIT